WLCCIQSQTLASPLGAVPGVRVNKCSKSKAETEMECAGVFIGPRVGIDAVIETDRADGQFITQPYAHRIAHVVETWFFRCREQIARVGENRALQFPENWKGVFDIKHGKKFTSDWM